MRYAIRHKVTKKYAFQAHSKDQWYDNLTDASLFNTEAKAVKKIRDADQLNPAWGFPTSGEMEVVKINLILAE